MLERKSQRIHLNASHNINASNSIEFLVLRMLLIIIFEGNGSDGTFGGRYCCYLFCHISHILLSLKFSSLVNPNLTTKPFSLPKSSSLNTHQTHFLITSPAPIPPHTHSPPLFITDNISHVIPSLSNLIPHRTHIDIHEPILSSHY